jgi:Ni/Co efflux regulator RcnB
MKPLIVAIAAMTIAGTSVAAAQADTDANANVKMEKSGTHARASVHKRKHHRHTVGRGGIETRDNNASARGSILPGKDRLNSKAYVVDH